MVIKRDKYLNQLITSKHNGLIKIITGLRRCGKSYLLFNLFKEHRLSNGVTDSHIIQVDLEDRRNKELRDPDALLAYIDSKITDDEMHYILLDEVQHVPEFEDVLNSYLKIDNADVYVTGSNSKFLSTDIITEFRGRGTQIHVYPLSFAEFMTVDDRHPLDAWPDYYTYGGLPHTLSLVDEEAKENYLKELYTKVYLTDIKERHSIRSDAELKELMEILASSIGSPTNPSKLERTFKSVKNVTLSDKTIDAYLSYFADAFLTEKAIRYDIKGKQYLQSGEKYYANDATMRYALVGRKNIDLGHILENIVYLELVRRGY